jgi:hypothetical protein
MSVGNRNFIASWGYRGLPIATSTEKRQRLDVRPMVWRNGTPCARVERAKRKRNDPYKQKSHHTQNLAPGANLACGGNGLASDASFCS